MGNSQPGLLQEARALWSALRGVAHDRVELAALETRIAGESLARMVAAGILIALLLLSAWLAILGAGVVGLVAAGMHPGWALLIAALVNLGGAAGLYFLVRRLARNLGFPGTVRSLRNEHPGAIATSEVH